MYRRNFSPNDFLNYMANYHYKKKKKKYEYQASGYTKLKVQNKEKTP